MRLTKFEHACLDIVDGASRLVVDPGMYSTGFKQFDGVSAVVITHIHPDHFDQEKITKIIAANPKVQLFTTQEVADKIDNSAVVIPEFGTTYSVGPFKLEFYGGQHASIAPGYPTAQNYGVSVNEALYYPGDSLVQCDKPHTFTAVPAMAPWLKFSEAAEFIAKDTATNIFPTHNGFLNKDGQDLMDRLLGNASETSQKTYQLLTPGSSIDIS